jgi:hypothetical protein
LVARTTVVHLHAAAADVVAAAGFGNLLFGAARPGLFAVMFRPPRGWHGVRGGLTRWGWLRRLRLLVAFLEAAEKAALLFLLVLVLLRAACRVPWGPRRRRLVCRNFFARFSHPRPTPPLTELQFPVSVLAVWWLRGRKLAGGVFGWHFRFGFYVHSVSYWFLLYFIVSASVVSISALLPVRTRITVFMPRRTVGHYRNVRLFTFLNT